MGNGKRPAVGGGERMSTSRQAIVRPYLLLVTTFVVSTILLKDSGYVEHLYLSQFSEDHAILFDVSVEAMNSPDGAVAAFSSSSRRYSDEITATMTKESVKADPQTTGGVIVDSAPTSRDEQERIDETRAKKITLSERPHIRSRAVNDSKPLATAKEIQTNNKSDFDENPSNDDSEIKNDTEELSEPNIRKGKSHAGESESSLPVKDIVARMA